MTSHGLYIRTRAAKPLSARPTDSPIPSRISAVNPEHFDDPVAAYDRLAAYYDALSSRREHYLRGVEREIISRIPNGSRSLLDVGAGNGTRALEIASRSEIKRVVLVEPSKQMAARSRGSAEVWPLRAEDLAVDAAAEKHPTWGLRKDEKFDVITCLWNVLGHVTTEEKRLRTLTGVAQLLAPQGRFFLDVNHRYNLRSYGIFPTSARYAHDLFVRNRNNGDVKARWNSGDATITTYGHVFSHAQIMRLADGAGLELEERLVMDYDDGCVRRFAFQGNLLYIFRRSSRIDSASAPQTS